MLEAGSCRQEDVLITVQQDVVRTQQSLRAELSQVLSSCGLPLLQAYPPYLQSLLQALAELRCGQRCAYVQNLVGNMQDFRYNAGIVARRIEDPSLEPSALARLRAEVKVLVALIRATVAHKDQLDYLQLSLEQLGHLAKMGVDVFAEMRAAPSMQAYGSCWAKCQLEMSHGKWLSEMQLLRWMSADINLHPMLLVLTDAILKPRARSSNTYCLPSPQPPEDAPGDTASTRPGQKRNRSPNPASRGYTYEPSMPEDPFTPSHHRETSLDFATGRHNLLAELWHPDSPQALDRGSIEDSDSDEEFTRLCQRISVDTGSGRADSVLLTPPPSTNSGPLAGPCLIHPSNMQAHGIVNWLGV
ncbi:hypothetical protein WJX73_007698 [Symbiochloris irregularis]|uniref:Uncharacterized protein n=1 Tax=Symbiochloris irregularis TaxID=706552 RepID=A0AAW1NYH2_9CHLO